MQFCAGMTFLGTSKDFFYQLSQILRVKGKNKYENRLTKGNMWSAIPVALLLMIVNWSEGKQGSGPEGYKLL